MTIIDKELMLNEHLCYMRAFDHIFMEKVCYKFLIVIIIIIIIIIIICDNFQSCRGVWVFWRSHFKTVLSLFLFI